MATIGTMWAIAIAIYEFVFGYFRETERRRSEPARRRKRSWKYAAVFLGYAVSGVLAGACILLSGMALAFDNPGLIWPAGATFVAALLLIITLLIWEVATSIGYVMDKGA